jgi:hypothetical protein
VSQWPEHEKLAAVKDQTQTIHDFLEWCGSRGIQLCQMERDEFWPVYDQNDLLAAWAGIDPEEIAAEKQQMLDELREMNGL